MKQHHPFVAASCFEIDWFSTNRVIIVPKLVSWVVMVGLAISVCLCPVLDVWATNSTANEAEANQTLLRFYATCQLAVMKPSKDYVRR